MTSGTYKFYDYKLITYSFICILSGSESYTLQVIEMFFVCYLFI